MRLYSRFITITLLTSKDSKIINKHIPQLVLWAGRRAGQQISNRSYSVNKVLSEKVVSFAMMRSRLGISRKELCMLKLDPKSRS